MTTIQAREAGVDPTQLRLLAGRGRLEHVARGVYRVPVLPRSQYDDLAFAIAWTRGRAVISHESALVLHGLSDVNPLVVHLTAPRDNHPRAQGGGPVRVHRRELPADDVTMVDGIPVTTVARTIEDCYELGTDPAQLHLAIRQARQTGDLAPAQAERLKQLIGRQVVPRSATPIPRLRRTCAHCVTGSHTCRAAMEWSSDDSSSTSAPPSVTVHEHWPLTYTQAVSSVHGLDLAVDVQEVALRVAEFIRRIDAAHT